MLAYGATCWFEPPRLRVRTVPLDDPPSSSLGALSRGGSSVYMANVVAESTQEGWPSEIDTGPKQEHRGCGQECRRGQDEPRQ
jgi:hypothetical protein